MINLIKNNFFLISNLLIIVFLLILPYLLFNGKFYISGDDTRLYYLFPFEYFKEHTFSSWHHFSSVGSYSSTQFMSPFLLIWSLLDVIIPSKIILSYLAFSLPLVLGFVFLQIFTNELLPKNKNNFTSLIAALFFICSPIIAINQLFIFLSTIWLLPLIPLLSYSFIKYVKTGQFKFLFISMVSCVIFSLALFSIPWVLGYAFPLFVGITIIFLLSKKIDKKTYLKRTAAFFIGMALSQLFWLFPFIMTYFGKSDINYGSRILSKGVADTFSPTVLSTAHGNVIYPLLNLFHRQITVDFGWDLRHVFYNFFDRTLILNLIFPLTLLSGLLLHKEVFDDKQKKIFTALLIAFVFTLYLFTVNIGPLKELFLEFGRIPGFVMFRNFFDKFALSFVIFYAILISYSLEALRRFNKRLFVITSILLVSVILINFSQVGKTVNAPLWQTKDIGRNIKISNEYIRFMEDVGKEVPTTNNIFTVPFGTALYSVIKDENSDSVYTGTSPVKLLSGVNDISGFMSFYFSEAHGIIENLIINKDYKNLQKILKAFNVNYVFVNKNIPDKVLNSWVFDRRMNKGQDKKFLEEIAQKKPLIVSQNKNYELYKLKETNTLLTSKNLTFKKINETKFKLNIKNLKGKQIFIFNDSYQGGWKLYPVKYSNLSWCEDIVEQNGVKECKESDVFIEGDEMSFLINETIFEKSQRIHSRFSVNSWELDSEYIKKNLKKEYYSLNPDGSINVEFTFFFLPQAYFYTGGIISALVILGSSYYLFVKRKKYVKKKN